MTEEGREDVEATGNACFMIPLPPEPIAIGKYWSSRIQVKVRVAAGVMRSLDLQRSYHLKSVSNGVAEITFATSLGPDVKSTQVKALLLQATPQGRVLFDLNKGRVLRRELRFDNFVLGAVGPNTMLSAKGRTIEKLLNAEAVAQTDPEPASGTPLD